MSSLGSLACSGSTDSSTVASTTTLPVLLDFTELPANEPHIWPLRVHCGAGVFSSQLNGNWWRTAEANHQLNWLPTEWGGNAATVDIPVIERGWRGAEAKGATAPGPFSAVANMKDDN